MSDRVKEILSWYSSENPGVLNNLARIMNTGRLAGTGKFVILPVDQASSTAPPVPSRRTRPATTPAITSSSPSTRAATPTRRPSAS